MSCHIAFNRTKRPTMYGNNFANNLITIVAKVPAFEDEEEEAFTHHSMAMCDVT